MGSVASPSRQRLVDYFLGPVADVLDLSADAAAAVAITAAAALGAALGQGHGPDRRLVLVSSRGTRTPGTSPGREPSTGQVR